jgi:hypothetical protein
MNNNEAWDEMCRVARLAGQSVELIVRYEPPSPYAGRKLRLFYNAATDERGHEWLD